MGSDVLQVVLDQLAATASGWQGAGAQLTGPAPPSPGQPFQATTAAINAINAAIGAAGAALTARTQSTAAGVATAAAGYGNQEAAAAGGMAAVTHAMVV
ncbi:hypothetical protein [Mycobacterium lacus]|uniref:Uncharacterized protein n=1 Tax=Mycobacterium lacus TaxID=169765 RepID=A0A1X1XVE4_9MYCO|nr:hypothetical protein [Mycobacterium lacus]MCV7124829.1 hypothetical protein [Mycobacterium lacus]ORW02734.1 hypothetical protein AWC15_06340 [Mycobacterium lacus]BBX94937.1 hypothetical protein MLAC_02310 [Mycobacterium lacus]